MVLSCAPVLRQFFRLSAHLPLPLPQDGYSSSKHTNIWHEVMTVVARRNMAGNALLAVLFLVVARQTVFEPGPVAPLLVLQQHCCRRIVG